MKTNRQVRRLFKPGITSMYRISNRQWLLCASNYQFVWHTKLSRQQRRARRIGDDALRGVIFGMARALKSGQHTQGERE